MKLGRIAVWSVCVGLTSMVLPTHVNAQGFILPGAGPVNNSMGGAAVAAPIDATGAIHWNPATITGLAGSSVDIGSEMLNVRHRVSSTTGGAAPTTSARNSAGWAALPAIGLVYQPDDSWMTFGLGLNTIGGFFLNFAASDSNPVFGPPPGGFGAVYSRLGLLQVTPTAAFQLTENVSIGLSPTITIADLQAAPFGFAAPNIDGTYPSAYNSRPRYGGGVHGGIYVATDRCWNFGASIKSPQWFEEFEFNSTDSDGTQRTLSLSFRYPMVLSLGTSYTGFERWILAADVRWFDYRSTPTFGAPAEFDSKGAVTGLDWDSIISVALGAQFKLNDAISLRMGYSWNENPIPDDKAFFSLQAAAVFQQTLNVGASMKITPSITMNMAYQHVFANAIEGPLHAPGVGPVAGTAIRIREELDALIAGVTVSF